MKDKPRICITCGDISGIGPEIIRKSLQDERISEIADFTVIGPEKAFENDFNGLNISFTGTGIADIEITPGKWTVQSGDISFQSIQTAVEGVINGRFDAMVTAPICKEAVNAAGHDFPGHTEMLKAWTGADDVIMMFLSREMIVGLMTVHVALSEVPKIINLDLALQKIRLLDHELKSRLKIENPSIALCALNPHAGENRMFGTEEDEILIPAAAEARKTGIRITDPMPADTLFKKASNYSAVLAIYHDQGLIPAKLAPGGSVNYTGGLPIIRTSPDHGTAFDIAGKGEADPKGMINAIDWAVKLCR
ncbi:MAG: 4-hydroxythreonine-4-phosphate dehydrogenase PdxA [FCB group bacterium]|nr:4-hydroxythreonine-4-phosphate dehydrogenase PdxA [FCB group bacterium]